MGTKPYAEQEPQQVGTQTSTEVDSSEMNPKLSPCDSVLVCVCVHMLPPMFGGQCNSLHICCQSPDTTSTGPGSLSRE